MLRLHIRCRSSDIAPIPAFQVAPATPSAESIAADIITSICHYFSVRGHSRPWATYGSILMVEAASLVKHSLMTSILNKSAPCTPQLALTSMCAAISCLNRFKMRVCTDASSELASVLSEVQLSIPFTVPLEISSDLSLSPNTRLMCSESHECDEKTPSKTDVLPSISYPRILDVSDGLAD